MKSLHFYAPAIFVTLILLNEIDSTFSLSVGTEYAEYSEFNGYNVDELQAESQAEKPYNFASILDDDDSLRLKKVVSASYVSIPCASEQFWCFFFF